MAQVTLSTPLRAWVVTVYICPLSNLDSLCYPWVCPSVRWWLSTSVPCLALMAQVTLSTPLRAWVVTVHICPQSNLDSLCYPWVCLSGSGWWLSTSVPCLSLIARVTLSTPLRAWVVTVHACPLSYLDSSCYPWVHPSEPGWWLLMSVSCPVL